MKYTINIPKPCHEDWSKMTPTERGKFCAVCKKDLYDFTRHSDYEILNRLRTDKNLCGRFRVDQLNKEYHIPETNRWQRLGVLLGFSSFFLGVQPAFSQSNETKTEIISQDNQQSEKNTEPLDEGDFTTISGNVVDDTGLPLPGVNILVKGTTIRTQTDFDGDFSINIPKEILNESTILSFSYVGFPTQEIPITSVLDLQIHMMYDESFQLELVTSGLVKVSPVRSLFYKIGNLFRKKH